MRDVHRRHDPDVILPEDVPVEMPELPISLNLATEQQFKAVADPVRSRILGIIQNQPATAKQIADRLGIAPGTIGHHLQVLEAAALAQVVARRQVRGTVAKYYTRTARLFNYCLASEITGSASTAVELTTLTKAREELAEALETQGKAAAVNTAFPHARLSAERAQVYADRLEGLLDDLLHEQPDPDGQVYGLCFALFVAPAYLQGDRRDGTSPPRQPVTPAVE